MTLLQMYLDHLERQEEKRDKLDRDISETKLIIEGFVV